VKYCTFCCGFNGTYTIVTWGPKSTFYEQPQDLSVY
jgi:hypothetical protein